MKFFKIAIILFVCSCSLVADYVNTKDYNIFYNTTKDVDLNNAEIKEVFFGTKDEFLKRDGITAGDVAVVAASAPYVIFTGVMTAGFATYVQYNQFKEIEAKKPIYFYLVVNIKDKNGVEAKGVAMFMSREDRYKDITAEKGQAEKDEIYKLCKGIFIK